MSNCVYVATIGVPGNDSVPPPNHHYHSTAHEVLGISRGKAAVRLGGDARGQTFEVRAGDVIIIPAGVAHKNLDSSSDFLVVGAYPLG
ncbi:cupin domain-containing protein [Chroococcidiopsis sp. CCMEE 29]|uniref:cupin domain-containing protein n=1 Tax=Chroococcidiopsis sp. CCMEE 29 TaxID=155894 RepID=UPI0020207B8B|nr:cupin domain-containing protein [Chroococcidiopsis sp. CCMEE 29]